MNAERIREIMRKEFRQAFREPQTRVLMIIPPIVQFLLFGFVANLDVERSRLGWMDRDRTPESRELRAAFEGSAYFTVTASPSSNAEADELLDRDEVRLVIVVMPGFGRDMTRGRQAEVQMLVEGTNSNTALILSGYAGDIVRKSSSARMLAIQNQKRVAGGVALSVPGIDLEQRVWYNPELKSRNYFLPGVLVNILTLITLMLTSMAIVREKEIGTMEQLMVSPITPLELMLGKTAPFAVVAMFDFCLMIVLARLVFRIPFQGSLLLLLAAAVLFLFSALGTGLFISTISQTQQQAVMSTFLFFQPAFMLSGFTFPIRNMPQPVRYLTMLNPVRYFTEVCRGVFLKGSGIDLLWPQLLALAVFGAVILFSSARRFRKKLD